MVGEASGSGAAPGAVQGIAAPGQKPARQDSAQRTIARRAADGAPPVDPADVESAVQRLDRLLENDAGNGPRQDAPPRGFYLNIVI